MILITKTLSQVAGSIYRFMGSWVRLNTDTGNLFDMSAVYPVLLAGGKGTRLWPLSRKTYPKQFSNLIGEKTLFQQSASM